MHWLQRLRVVIKPVILDVVEKIRKKALENFYDLLPLPILLAHRIQIGVNVF